jgi:L-fuconolactonase
MPNQEWLDLTVEETLEPDLPICDPHHHLWDRRDPYVIPRYLLDEILVDVTCGHNILSTVHIECGSMYRATGPEEMRSVGETEFANGIAAMSASGLYGNTLVAAGIVGAAELTLGAAVGPVLDAHIAASPDRFRGIRHQATWDASDEVPNGRTNPVAHIYSNAIFREGFATLAPRGLSFEGWCYHPQLPDLIDLARAFPDTMIILNHFGGPIGVGPYAATRDQDFPVWKQAIVDLASCPNVVAKLGGLNMEINGFAWHAQERPPSSQVLMEATRDYYEHTIEQFGAGRCMFESNFPVDKLSCSYNILWNSFKRLTAGYSVADRADLFHKTAKRIYRLG